MPDSALVVVDMLNPYDHEDAEPLAASVRDVLPQIVELRDHARDAEDTMLLYVNDNYERWDLTRDDIVEQALAGERRDLIEPIVPPGDVPFLVKGRHSIFYQTSVAHLLQVAGVKHLVLCGQVTEQCILYSTLDAYLRGYDVHVPRDAVAHIHDEWAEASLAMMAENMHAALDPVRTPA